MSNNPQNKVCRNLVYTELRYDIATEEYGQGKQKNGNQGLRDWLMLNIKPPYEKPFLIKTDYYDIIDEIKRRMFSIREKSMNEFSFMLNSSIWIRLCDENDDAKTSGSKAEIAEKEFNWFNKIGLYDFKAAREYIEHQSRIQQQNYLDETIGGHDTRITPFIYSNEVEYRDFFIKENGNINFKFLKANVNEGCTDFKAENVALRILLVDDKIGNNKNLDCKNECTNCRIQKETKGEAGDKGEPCKLNVICKLLSGEFISDPNKQKRFNEKTHWFDVKYNEKGDQEEIKVKSYGIDKVKILDVWEQSSGKSKLEIKKDWLKDWNNFIGDETDCVQIVGVRDLESALALMSCCKFDIILLDYLLGERSIPQPGRVYSTELFEFLSYDFQKKPDSDIVTMLKTESGFNDNQLKQFRDEVKLNRGPLDKYWIVPMTSYNSSFISDLQRRNVRLIDHRWNISQGADPINTPWRFLYKLNEFVDLQLRSSVYWKKQLMTFVRYTCEDFKTRFEKIQNEEVSCFEEFQQFMGAEYANFMKRYGARKLIERDAFGDPSDQSLFAKYVNENFYNNYNKYGIETELNRLMQSFYYTASIMFDDRYGRQHLREAFERMRMFIAYNKLEDSLEIDEDKKKLLRGLRFLYAVIDSEFNCAKIDKWLEKNKQ